MPGTEKAPQDRFIDANGLRLHYLDWGGSGDAVILLHGLSGNAHGFDYMAPTLAEQHHVLSVDMRGHGDSQWSTSYWPEDYIVDIKSLVDQLQLAPFHLLGHSLGSMVSQAYAGAHGKDLKSLMLLDAGPEISDERSGVTAQQSQVPQRNSFRNMEAAIAATMEGSPGSSKESIERRLRYALRENWVGRLVWKHDRELTWLRGAAGLKMRPRLWAALATVRCPTLIVRGETSDILSKGIVARMLETVPHAKSVEIKGVGHNLGDNPADTMGAVQSFLGSVG